MSDWLLRLHESNPAFPIWIIAIRTVVALAIGLLVGFEREWAQKDTGVRTFGLTALLGMLSSLMGEGLMLLSLGATLVVVIFVNIRSLLTEKSLEATTSVALITTFVLGVLVGRGHLFTPVSAAIVMTMLLSLKPQFSHFAGRLTSAEVKSFVLLGLIGFVIWPLLPDRFVDPWQLLQPREAWVTVIVIAAFGFINYVLLRLYEEKGVYLTALLGGMVSSTTAGAELSASLPKAGLTQTVVPALMLTCVSMFLRNLVLLALFAPESMKSAILPLLAMTLVSLVYAYLGRKAAREGKGQVEMNLDSPVSLKRVLSFGAMFLFIQVLSTLGQRFVGSSGLMAVSILGGLISSATSTAAAANLARHGQISMGQAGVATVLASMASAVADVPIAWKLVKDRGVTRTLIWSTLLRLALGAAVIGASAWFF